MKDFLKNINWKKGFNRLAISISAFCIIIGALWAVLAVEFLAFGIGIVCAVINYLIFLLLCWFVKGFGNGEDVQKVSTIDFKKPFIVMTCLFVFVSLFCGYQAYKISGYKSIITANEFTINSQKEQIESLYNESGEYLKKLDAVMTDNENLTKSLQNSNKLLKAKRIANVYYTLGASMNEVRAAQGTPDKVDTFYNGDVWWHYGYSKLEFKNGYLDSYDNHGELNIK